MKRLLEEVRACTACVPHLPLGPRPIVEASRGARVVIIGQAPGTKVHASGIPWEDDSGERLREWLGVDHATFHDRNRFAIVPMGFCYPGKRKGGDAPPRKECAPLWHARILAGLPKLKLKLLVGSYAQAHYLGKERPKTMTATVRAYADFLPEMFPLPHPSWRSAIFARRNPWFEAQVLPALRDAVAAALRA